MGFRQMVGLGFMLFSVQLWGQTLELGVQGNYTISQMWTGSSTSFDTGDLKAVPVGTIGMSGYISHQVCHRWSLTAEPGITNAGSLIRADHRMDVLLTENRLSLPLMADYHISQQFSASAGLAASYLLGQSETERIEEPPTGSNYRDFTLSLVAGLTLDIAPTAALGLRYQRGLTHSYDISVRKQGDYGYEKVSARQHQLQFFVRFFIVADK